ncbi:hypothetical protein, partial [Flavobacterium sp.]|uniref:hypothetical protein n=1 Tax=Flavobacterium sp. TaxID=239 RepID=UPI00374D3142
NGYAYSNDNGFFKLVCTLKETECKIVISSLGYKKEEYKLNLLEQNNDLNFILDEKTEALSEVIIESYPIRTEGDTTTVKIAKFVNQTEQTLEDVLRKIPGIEVQKDGSIKAHGRYIDKLLIEGDDIFDKNYKLLSKNLDAKVLDAVQILDNFEDNPILKNMVNSNKVAINLKIKKNKKNIWFGNVNLGAGVVSENRWKESINLGLLRKKIKLFYFADYNNSGEKATDLMIESVNDNDLFVEDRYEKKAKPFYNINSNENSMFSKSQSIVNNAFLNSLSFTTKLKPNFTLRGQSFFTNDNQIQDSFSETKYNIDISPVVFSETNNYKNKKTLASVELELKYFANEKNYFTNLFIYKNNPSNIFNILNFNNNLITQSSKLYNQSIYNHLYHTFKLSKKNVLNNYFYYGNDKLDNKNNISSPFLNDYFNINSNGIINQNFNQNLFYFGLKSKLISKYKKINYVLDFNFENNQETISNNFLVNDVNEKLYENDLKLKQNILSIGNGFRYDFSKKINLTASLNYTQNSFNIYSKQDNISLFNPQVSLNLRDNKFGVLFLTYSKNSKIPEINILIKNTVLNSYNSFIKGTPYEKPIESVLYSISHSLLNDEKRFAVNTTVSYLNVKSTMRLENTINQNFILANYGLANGGKSHIINFNFINYFRGLKTSLKIDTNQTFNNNPTKVNSNEFSDLKSYSSYYKISGTSYFTLPFNFDFGVRYNYYQSSFNGLESKNITKDAFVNFNYKITKSLLVEFNSMLYKLNKANYSFLNAVINYTPASTKLSYRLLFNNITNENNFSITSLDNYASNTTSINLIPRYVLLNIKYRF